MDERRFNKTLFRAHLTSYLAIKQNEVNVQTRKHFQRLNYTLFGTENWAQRHADKYAWKWDGKNRRRLEGGKNRRSSSTNVRKRTVLGNVRNGEKVQGNSAEILDNHPRNNIGRRQTKIYRSNGFSRLKLDR